MQRQYRNVERVLQTVILIAEPMKMPDIPDLPWNAVGTDLFQFDNHNHVIVVDYYSRYFEIARLENTKASCVISHIKSIFDIHGIP